jgi:hypothetical protein
VVTRGSGPGPRGESRRSSGWVCGETTGTCGRKSPGLFPLVGPGPSDCSSTPHQTFNFVIGVHRHRLRKVFRFTFGIFDDGTRLDFSIHFSLPGGVLRLLDLPIWHVNLFRFEWEIIRRGIDVLALTSGGWAGLLRAGSLRLLDCSVLGNGNSVVRWNLFLSLPRGLRRRFWFDVFVGGLANLTQDFSKFCCNIID